MSWSRSKSIAAAIAAVVVVGVVFVALLPRSVDEPPPPAGLDTDPPVSFPEKWSDTEGGERIVVELDSAPQWRDSAGALLLSGPTPNAIEMSWSHQEAEGWKLATGSGHGDGVDLYAQIWSAPGYPQVIIDFDAQISADAAAEPLTVATSTPGDDAQMISAALQPTQVDSDNMGADLLALASHKGPLKMHSPGAAHGQLVDVGDTAEVEWSIWPGLDEELNCSDTASGHYRASLRLVIQFGDQPLAAPLPAPPDTDSLGTPIFVDAPASGGNAWEDGRARNAEDFASRLRTLAYGHSDRDDPRHGNGGLLAAGMGAIFAVPHDWWDEPPVESLRRSLRDTEIDAVRIDDPSSQIQITDGDLCEHLTGDGPASDSPSTLVVKADGDRPFELPLAGPVPAVLVAGSSSTERSQLLDRLFPSPHTDSLFADGSHRGVFIPVVATRNPLEGISSQNILSPDRGGEWTLHDTLTRRLGRYEMSHRHDAHQSTGLSGLQRLRQGQQKSVTGWNPDGTIAIDGEPGSHLYFLSTDGELLVNGETRAELFSTWQLDGDKSVKYSAGLSPVTIEFEGD